MYKGDVSICVPVSAVARLCASDVDMPGWHEGSVGGSNCKTGLGMGQASGKISCHLVPMKKAGGQRVTTGCCPLPALRVPPSFCAAPLGVRCLELTDRGCFLSFLFLPTVGSECYQ